jgi:hypothetical protein
MFGAVGKSDGRDVRSIVSGGGACNTIDRATKQTRRRGLGAPQIKIGAKLMFEFRSRGRGTVRKSASAAFALLLSAMLCAFGIPSAVSADSYLAPPPDRLIVTPGGVDMRSGRYVYSHTDLSIGGESGLELTRTMRQEEPGHHDPFGYFSHNFDIRAMQTSVNCLAGDFRAGSGADAQVQILSGGLSATFRTCDQSAGNFAIASSGGYGNLTFVGDKGPTTVYTFQSDDGTTITFRPIGSGDCPGTMCAYASQLVRPDGTVLSFQYDTAGTGTLQTRLRTVTSTRGQGLILEYSGMFITKACVVNLATTAIATTCPAGVPTATYTYDTLAGEQRLAQVTDPTNALWKFVNGTGANGATTLGFINPGESSPWLTNTMSTYTDDNGIWDIVGGQTFADGQSYSYGYDFGPADVSGTNGGHIPDLAGGFYVDAQGNETDVTFEWPVLPTTAPGNQCTHLPCVYTTTDSIVYQQSAGPYMITDPLGRVTNISYHDPNAIRYLLPLKQSVTDPDGFKTTLTWEIEKQRLVESDAVSKSGTGPNLVRTAAYTCTDMHCITKPTSITDANGNTTIYHYKPENGGIIHEIKPAPTSGAPRPLKLTTWVLKYAYVLNGGSLGQASSPVWVISSETECQLAPGGDTSNPTCDTAPSAPQRVTTYEYGADGTPNNLFVRGIVLTADGSSRRTCNSYDNFGNRISQTAARAGLSTCP